MLKQLRSKKLARRILRGTLILIIPAFVVFYGWSQLDQTNPERMRSFATVKPPSALPFWPFAKSEPITANEMVLAGDSLLRKTQQAYSMAQSPYIPQGRPFDLFSNGEIMREAVNLRIIRRYAEEKGLTVSDEALLEYIKTTMPQMADPQYRQAILRNMGKSDDEFLASVRDGMIYDRVFNTFLNRSKVSLFELWQEYTLQKDNLQLDYVRIPAERFKAGVAIDEKALQEFFQKNRADYRVPDQRIYQYVSISSDEVEQQIEITDADVRKYYDENKAMFQTSRRAQVRQIKMAYPDSEMPVATPEMVKRMNDLHEKVTAKDANFEQVANDAALETLVMDQSSTATLPVEAGELGWVSTENNAEYGEELVQAAINLQKAGEISEVVRSSQGLHILQAIAFEEPKDRPFEGEVIDLARTQVRALKLSEALEEWNAKLKKAVEDSATLAEVAKATGLEIQTTELLNADETVIDPGVGSLAKDRDFLAMLRRTDDVALLTTPQGAIALKVEKEVPAHDPELAEVREAVEDDYRTAKALEQADALAKQAIEGGKTLEALQDWAEKQNLRVETTASFERAASPAEITERIEGLQNLTYRTPVGAVRMAPLKMGEDETGYIVFRIRQIQPPSREKFQEDYYQFQREMVFLKQWSMMEEWLTEQRKDWKIVRATLENE